MDDRRIARIFTRMAHLYGSRWTSQHEGADAAVLAMATWKAGLAGVDDFSIKRAIETCVNGGGEWPPSLPTFRALCVGMQGEAAERASQQKALPAPDEPVSEPPASDTVGMMFQRALSETHERIRASYGDAPDGGHQDFLAECKRTGMRWAAKHFTEAAKA